MWHRDMSLLNGAWIAQASGSRNCISLIPPATLRLCSVFEILNALLYFLALNLPPLSCVCSAAGNRRSPGPRTRINGAIACHRPPVDFTLPILPLISFAYSAMDCHQPCLFCQFRKHGLSFPLILSDSYTVTCINGATACHWPPVDFTLPTLAYSAIDCH